MTGNTVHLLLSTPIAAIIPPMSVRREAVLRLARADRRGRTPHRQAAGKLIAPGRGVHRHRHVVGL